jgi:hypothetical protein
VSSCDLAAVEALSVSLVSVKAEERVAAAAAGWAKLCPADAVLAGQIAQIATASPESWWLVELQTGLVDAYGWSRACEGGTLALSMATKLDPSQRRPYLWKECGLDTLGVFTAAEWNEATGLLILPLVAHKALLDGFVPKEKARPIARALAGL